MSSLKFCLCGGVTETRSKNRGSQAHINWTCHIVDRLSMGCRHWAGFTYRLSRLKPRASWKMGDLITNNQDLFLFSLPILSWENRISEYVHTFFFALHYTDIFSENTTSEDVKTFFCSSNQFDQIAWGLSLSKSGPQERI